MTEATKRTVRGPWWWRGARRRPLDPERRREILNDLYFEGADRAPFLGRFSVLLVLSVVIAALGLVLSSTAVVIGAMLVAPLMTPLIGLSAAFVMGWPRRQLEQALIVAGGSIVAVAAAWAVMKILPEPRAVTLQSNELLARTEPTMLDLGVAVAAGAAGAYVLVRREALSALPGVAVAVALVPPLATAGITLELGHTDLTKGALLLYVTNLAGIVVAAIAVLLVTGFNPLAGRKKLPARIRLGIASAIVLFVAVSIPLQNLTREAVRESVREDDAAQEAKPWIAGRDLHVTNVSSEGGKVVLDLVGADRPPPAKPLADELAKRWNQPVDVTVRWTRRERESARAG